MTTFDATTGLRVLGEDGWDAARQAFNLLIDQRPAMIAYAMFGGGAVMDESMAVAVQARMALVTGALAPYDAGRYLNFVEEPTHAEVGFPAESYRRLQAARRAYDPDKRFQANHRIA